MAPQTRICAGSIRYIKLGVNGGWERLCLEDGTLRIGYYEVPHNLGQSQDQQGIREIYLGRAADSRTASSHASQVLAFYDPNPDVMWITFADGYLWWCFAQPEVEFFTHDRDAGSAGSRLRRTTGGWSNKTLAGELLRIAELNGALTQLNGYRGTICNVKSETAADLIRRINGEGIPEVAAARAARQAGLVALEALIRRLSPMDFELFVDLIFANSGWRRVSVLGKTQKTVDMELVQPVTQQRAFIQVKSTTTQSELDDYVAKLACRGDDFMFYAYHSSHVPLTTENGQVRLLNAAALSEMGWQVGLFDWLVQKSM